MMERRVASEVRAQGRRLVGYAATFDVEARIGSFTEVIRPGAFRRGLAQGRDILALVDHDPSRLLARTGTGTLQLQEDERGLTFAIDMPETQLGNDVLEMAGRGDLGGMSFGFLPAENGGERWENNRRELLDVELMEISVVHAWPAYDGTSVSARRHTPALNRLTRYLETV